MTALDPAAVASLPEVAVLELLGATLQVTIITLLAAHPRMQRDEPPPGCCSTEPSACCLAGGIIELAHQLDHAIIHYRDLVTAELEAERRHQLPF